MKKTKEKTQVSEKPKAGEWWEHKSGAKLYIVGKRSDGTTIVENDRGFVSSFCDFESWRHLPHCTGFDWQEKTEQPDLLAADRQSA
jgi:hypothetical protein